MKTEAQIYRDAIKVLERDGWCQGFYTDFNGRHCIVGSMRNYFEMLPWPSTLQDVCGCSITEFNDVMCKTRDDAIAALSIAADLAS